MLWLKGFNEEPFLCLAGSLRHNLATLPLPLPPPASRLSSLRQRVSQGLCLFRQMDSHLDASYQVSKQAQALPECLLGRRWVLGFSRKEVY